MMNNYRRKRESGEVYFIAELSANHGNSLDIALKTVEAASEAGADCLKVQTYTADSMTLDCGRDEFIITDGLWAGLRLYDLYAQASLPYEWHSAIRDKCMELGLDFLSTPFDEGAVDFLLELGCDTFKIASFELTHLPLINYAASKAKTMIVSTGMATEEEIWDCVNSCRAVGCNDIVLLRCSSEYPAVPERMNLSSIPEMARKFGVPIGFSDHSEGWFADVLAVALGASVIEKHICLDGPIESADAVFSMRPAEFRDMVDAAKRARMCMGLPTFGAIGSEVRSLKFRRSCFAARSIREGELFTSDNVRIVRPSAGLLPKYYEGLLGTVADRDYLFGEPISEELARR